MCCWKSSYSHVKNFLHTLQLPTDPKLPTEKGRMHRVAGFQCVLFGLFEIEHHHPFISTTGTFESPLKTMFHSLQVKVQPDRLVSCGSFRSFVNRSFAGTTTALATGGIRDGNGHSRLILQT
eukprot:scaffold2557_cov121-Cylindrotheca_fusiformis.AAC.25